jgi:hypothetical protein
MYQIWRRNISGTISLDVKLLVTCQFDTWLNYWMNYWIVFCWLGTPVRPLLKSFIPCMSLQTAQWNPNGSAIRSSQHLGMGKEIWDSDCQPRLRGPPKRSWSHRQRENYWEICLGSTTMATREIIWRGSGCTRCKILCDWRVVYSEDYWSQEHHQLRTDTSGCRWGSWRYHTNTTQSH